MLFDKIDEVASFLRGKATCDSVVKKSDTTGIEKSITVYETDGTILSGTCVKNCSMFSSALCPCVDFFKTAEKNASN